MELSDGNGIVHKTNTIMDVVSVKRGLRLHVLDFVTNCRIVPTLAPTSLMRR
jgi:hypothetical protein